MGEPVVVIELDGEPVAKERPKFARIGRGEGSFVSVYTPAKTVAYTRAIVLKAKAAMRGRPLITGPLCLTVISYRPLLASFTKQQRADALAGIKRPTSKPDWDNYGKIVSDALNCVVFCDDAQIVSGRVEKFYSDRPRLRVEITTFGEGVS
jgi:Holliday junction resolvase RusA-like endonuclease